MSKPFLSVIIPAYNEESRIPETLKKVRDFLENQTYTFEVYVVDDGSKDGMRKIVSDMIVDKSKWPNFKIISYDKNRGKGYAVKKGMLEAQGQWRLLMDADNSTDISEIEKLMKYSNHYEIIIGSRYLDKRSIKVRQPLIRRIVSRIGNIIVRVLLGLKPLDTQCGFKLFSAEAAEEIFPLQTIYRWGFDVEILSIGVHKGYEIKEVAVDWYDATNSRVKKTAIFKTLSEIYTIKRNMMRGKYDK